MYKSLTLVRGKSSWTLTRFADDCFVARNSWGKSHTYRSGAEIQNFEEFLLSKGYAPIQRGRALKALVRNPVAKQLVMELASV